MTALLHRLAPTDPTRILLLQVLALVLPLMAAFGQRGAGVTAVLATALATAMVWELVFAALRRRAPTAHGLVLAMIVAVLAPVDAPLWQLALALSLGVVLGELVFGGRGFGFLSTAATVLVLLDFSFPQTVLPAAGGSIAWATLPGAVLLLATGLIPWRVLLAAGLGFAATLWGLTGSTDLTAAPGLFFAAVFLVCDPFGAASTQAGRWLYGALVGYLTALFAGAGLPVVATEAIVFATLLGNVLAPLLDQLVILAGPALHRRRHD